MPGNRTIPRLWRDAVARNTRRRLPRRARRHLAGGAVGRGGGAGRRTSPTASSRAASARATPSASSRATPSSGRSSTSRSRTSAPSARRSTRSSAPSDVQYVLAHSESVGVLCEDDDTAREGRGGRRVAPRPAARPHVRRPAGARGGGPGSTRQANPAALDDAVAAIDEEDLFTFIYTSGTTGPPKGCMIRHRNYYAMVATADGLPDAGGPGDVMLLYLPLAHNFGRLMHLSGPYSGLRDRLPRRPARRRAGAAGGPADDPPERAPRVREGAHRGGVDVRRGDRGAAPPDRLGDAGRQAGERAAPAGQRRAASGSPSSTAWRTGSSTRR